MKKKTIFLCLTALYVFAGFLLLRRTGALGDFPKLDQPGFVAKVSSSYGNFTDVGSGVLVREDLVLTCFHVIRDGRKFGRGLVEVEVGAGDIRVAEVIKVDILHDLALLKIPVVLNVPVTPGSRPVRGDTLRICGFPDGEYYSEVVGKVSGFASVSRIGKVLDVIKVNNVSKGGMSGGPVLNTDGELVGILFGSDDYSNTTGINTIRKFIGK